MEIYLYRSHESIVKSHKSVKEFHKELYTNYIFQTKETVKAK